jgi:hypothetical protein
MKCIEKETLPMFAPLRPTSAQQKAAGLPRSAASCWGFPPGVVLSPEQFPAADQQGEEVEKLTNCRFSLTVGVAL